VSIELHPFLWPIFSVAVLPIFRVEIGEKPRQQWLFKGLPFSI
jgi:hypothetical protein